MDSVASLPESQAACQHRVLKSPCAWELTKQTPGPVSDSLSQVSVQWLRHHTLGHMAHGRPTEAQRGRVACPGSLVHGKQAGTGPRQGLLLDHDGLGSHATRSGDVREQPGWRWRTVSMLGPRCGQSLFRSASPSPDLRPLPLPSSASPMPIAHCLLSSESPLYPPEVLCCLSVPIPHCCPGDQLLPHQSLPGAKPAVRAPSAPFNHLRPNLQKFPQATGICLDSKQVVKGQTRLRAPGEIPGTGCPLA